MRDYQDRKGIYSSGQSDQNRKREEANMTSESYKKNEAPVVTKIVHSGIHTILPEK